MAWYSRSISAACRFSGSSEKSTVTSIAPQSQFVVEQRKDRQVVQPVVFQPGAAERPFPAEPCFLRYPYRRCVVRVRREPGSLDAAFGERPSGDRAKCLRRVPLAALVAADAVADLHRADLPVGVEQADG